MGITVIIILAQCPCCGAEGHAQFLTVDQLNCLVDPGLQLFGLDAFSMTQRPQLTDFSGKFSNELDKTGSLGSRGPLQIITLRIYADSLKNSFDKNIDTLGIVITNLVMAFTKLSTAGENTGRAFGKTLQDKGRVDASGTHDTDGTQIGRVLVT
jgi:hypothetical protein